MKFISISSNIKELNRLTNWVKSCNNGDNKTRQGYAAMHLKPAGCFFLGVCNA